MSNEKKYTPEQAALAVLAKVSEMLQNSTLSKTFKFDKERHFNNASDAKGVHTPMFDKKGGTSHAGFESKGAKKVRDEGSPGVTDPKSREKVANARNETSKTIHRKVLNEMKDMPKPKLTKDEPQAEPDSHTPESVDAMPKAQTKGVHKLSKFVGRMEGKKLPSHGGIQNHQAESQKGVHEAAPNTDGSEGISEAGDYARKATSFDSKSFNNTSKKMHSDKLAELKAMPKPKLTKGDN